MKSASSQTCALPTGGLSSCRCSSIHFWKSRALSTALQLDADVRRFGIEVQRVQPAFAPDSRELGAAEWRTQVPQEPAVHPGDADFHRLPDAVAACEVGGPHRRSKAVGRVVRHVDRLFLLVEWRDVGAGPEDLLAYRARGFRQPGPQRRLDPGAVVARVAELRHAAAGNHLRTLLFRELVVGEHLLAVLLRDERACSRRLVLREAE